MPGMACELFSGDDGLIWLVLLSKDSNLKTGFYIGKSDRLMHTSLSTTGRSRKPCT